MSRTAGSAGAAAEKSKKRKKFFFFVMISGREKLVFVCVFSTRSSFEYLGEIVVVSRAGGENKKKRDQKD